MKDVLAVVLLAGSLLLTPSVSAHEDGNGHTVSTERRVVAPSGWWKGNTHTHTWWSDGDSPPESVAAWYRERDYNFLVLSDHNRMQEGEFWYRVDTDAKRAALQTYLRQFGDEWVERRQRDGVTEVKLKTLDEFRSYFEGRNQFIFIRGMEITDRLDTHPVHVNGVNLERAIIPQGGSSVSEIIQKNIDAVAEQGRRSGRPMFAHVNHPNFYQAITAEDLIALEHGPGEGFFEVYNGHPGVRNEGDARFMSVERMWDVVLSNRIGEQHKSIVYGVATDDAHQYTDWGLRAVNPGRGWVMVRAPRLTPDSISAAMKRGDFYNSTGVTLSALRREGSTLELEVKAEPGVSYTIEFVGTRRSTKLAGTPETDNSEFPGGRVSLQYDAAIGEVLSRIEGTRATYTLKGDELYVRARVISSRLHPNPYSQGDREMAWTQPVLGSSK
ncbi:MAG: histidinol-phosphatase [Gammaproteobacteria bacterium]|nr:histidinol-phosphatase [Gammaproteobacteria bacterium]